MSKRYTPAFGGTPRVLCQPAGRKATWIDCVTANLPVDGKAGYEPGCTAQVLDGVAGSQFYINTGTATSCAFRAVQAISMAERIVTVTGTQLIMTAADHDGKILVLDRAAGMDVLLPAATAGMRFRMIIKTTFTGNGSVQCSSAGGTMIGHALMGNNSDNAVVDWQAVAGSAINTIDLLGTGNSTGGMAGQEMEFIGIAAGLYFVSIRGDAAGTEATPFSSV